MNVRFDNISNEECNQYNVYIDDLLKKIKTNRKILLVKILELENESCILRLKELNIKDKNELDKFVLDVNANNSKRNLLLNEYNEQGERIDNILKELIN